MSDIKRTMPVYEPAEGMQTAPAFTPPAPKKSGWGTKLLVIILIIVVVLVGLFLLSKYTSCNILNVNKGPSASGWQAVFLSNGQVYFGKIIKETGSTVVLKDIYYLQVAQSPQPATEGQQAQQNLSLVKLGNELHGPRDEMKINRDHVLFTEDLKSDSRVVDAIVRYLEEGQ